MVGIVRKSETYIILILRLLISGILIFSAFGKLTYTGSRALDPQMAKTLNVFIFIPLSWIHFYVSALPWIELIIAVFFLLGVHIRVFAAFFIMVVITFLISNGMFLYYGTEGSCNCCFGDLASMRLPQAILLDLILLAAGLWLILKGKYDFFTLHALRKGLG